MQLEQAAKLTRERHFFRFWMPYLFQRIDVDGVRWAFLPLNRNYKPLGFILRDFVDYPAYAVTHGVSFARNPAKLVGVWHTISEDGSQLWLYEDDPRSRVDYFERFARIMSRGLPVLSLEGR